MESKGYQHQKTESIARFPGIIECIYEQLDKMLPSNQRIFVSMNHMDEFSEEHSYERQLLGRTRPTEFESSSKK